MRNDMREDTSVAQQVYEFIVRAGRTVRTREIVIALGVRSVSSVTFALTRLVREGNIERLGHGIYRVSGAASEPSATPELSTRLARIFEEIRPHLNFEDLSYLHFLVLTVQRLAPDLFKEQRRG
jgi:predicted transcriptional regulator of viral defense system